MGGMIGVAMILVGGISFLILVLEIGIGKVVLFDLPIRNGALSYLFRFVAAVFACLIVYSGVRVYLNDAKMMANLSEALEKESEEALKRSSEHHPQNGGVFKILEKNDFGSILKDTTTGCEFIITSSNQILPRPDSTGKQICRK